MSNGNNKPTAEDQKYPQLIFKAEVIELPNGKKDIEFTCKSNHIPTLDNILNELNYHIIELRAIHKAEQARKKIGLLTKGPIMSLNQFLNGKRR